MALALGLGSIFNHSSSPNVSYTLDTETDSIRYTTTRQIEPDEELCIFYGHKIWFVDCNADAGAAQDQEQDDGWGGLSAVVEQLDISEDELDVNPFEDGDPNEVITECDLPFTRLRITSDNDEEEDLNSIRTIEVWIVDIPDPRHTTTMLRWLKQTGLDDPTLSHLKRIRKQDENTSLLLARNRPTFPLPDLPDDIGLSQPYTLSVPSTAALTLSSLKLKSSLWPTVYAPRRKGEAEEWSRGKVKWACDAMKTVVRSARRAQENGELPIAAHVPVPFEGEKSDMLPIPFTAHDTRKSLVHPLRHSFLNVIRSVADFRASASRAASPPPLITAVSPSLVEDRPDTPSGADSETLRNGSHYLLTSLTLFSTHEPCLMCSMALLHSRVKEVYYLIPMENTGGCGGIACLPKLEGVNHRFAIGKWKNGEGGVDTRGLDVDRMIDA
ncbi:hypothetical protein JAAARDRAFT_171049 [Jaapia argillacea MUCL 33604]|uniref:SET domain-containing protein n=1 Tax=Jaapia argillacea MUCL 33604 TaxID=933084 RepID=A0A067Q6I2_9AGAM|nr:hypothetical protein JAAARDRAFT_171049 [Jaapia argillacea MUCL 33604]